jgi:hypothetical protein
MVLTLERLGQVTFIMGLIIIFSIIAFASIFPNNGNTLILAVGLMFGAGCVMFRMVENTEIPK